MDAVINAIAKAIKWFSDIFVAIFVAIWDVLTDIFSWLLEGLLGIAVSAANSLDVSGLESYSNSYGDMPSEIINVMQLAGLGTASQIVIAAIGIRLLLQIIPFTRLGS